VIEAANRTASITFDGATVTITRNRSAFGVDKGTRTIPIAQISAIQMKAAGKWSGAGHIRFVIAGTQEHRYRQTQVFKTDVLKDANAVPFGYKQQPEFEAVKTAVEQAIAQQQSGAAPQVGPSVADELRKLGELLQQGILSADEFAAAKGRLLGP
jgi:hypothetical protein